MCSNWWQIYGLSRNFNTWKSLRNFIFDCVVILLCLLLFALFLCFCNALMFFIIMISTKQSMRIRNPQSPYIQLDVNHQREHFPYYCGEFGSDTSILFYNTDIIATQRTYFVQHWGIGCQMILCLTWQFVGFANPRLLLCDH